MEISDKKFRRQEKRPNEADEAFLGGLNERLAETPAAGAVPRHPVVFTTGTPRSGTTVIAQSVANYFKVDYVDGLAARFWLAPTAGLRLSHAVFQARRGSDYVSDFGRASLFDIHSFHYFWMHHLKLEHVWDLFSPPADRGVDWDGLVGHIAAMQEVQGGPFAFKGYYPSYFMAEFCTRIPGAVFVVMRREEVVRQAESLYEARLAYHGTADIWHSMHPPEILELAKQPTEDQIAGQIRGLNAYFDKQIAEGGDRIRAVNVRYEDFTEDPVATLETIGNEVERLTREPLPRQGVAPVIRERKRLEVPSEISQRLADALSRYRDL